LNRAQQPVEKLIRRQEVPMKKFSPWLWTGGIIGVLTMGALRFLGKGTNIFGLLLGMAVVIAVLAFLVINYVNKKW
jgi:predicted lipid-binding transport protein (Tim44 family)